MATDAFRGPSAHQSLKDRAYRRLKEGILANRFESGSFLSEKRAAEWLKMSRTPVKAAFERLKHEGFVKVSPQQGILVKDLGLQEIVDHFEAREALETYIARQIAGRLTAPQQGQLSQCLDRLKENAETGDVSQTIKLDGDFHMLLCAFLGNEEMIRIMNTLKEKMYRVINNVYHRFPECVEASYAGHKGIADMIIRGDGEEAARLMIEHLENGKRFLLSSRR